MDVRCDRLPPVLSSLFFDLFIALSASKVPAKRGTVFLQIESMLHIGQQRVAKLACYGQRSYSFDFIVMLAEF